MSVAHWLIGSFLLFAGFAVAAFSYGGVGIPGLIVSFLLVMVAGLFWMSAARSQLAGGN